MGVVYRAFDRHQRREVAIKTLAPLPGHELVAYLRFNREARTASALRHPNVCQVFEVRYFEGVPYIVMELLHGETIRDLLMRGPCSGERALDLVRQVATGLAVVHEHDVIHRDIKPANVFVTTEGVVKLLDFGLAKHWAAADALTDESVTITQTGVTPGTVNYMSPEQLLGLRLDPHTDLFSLGVVLFELLTGRRPFSGATATASIAATLHKRRPPLPRIPRAAEWGDILDGLLAKDPGERYPHARALIEDLDLLERVMRGHDRWPSRSPALETAPRLSLAILPFKAVRQRRDSSGYSGDVESFCHGLLEAALSGLARVPGLRVVAKTLTSTVSRRGKGLSRIGRELNADRLLMGTVELRAGRYLVTTTLFDVALEQVVQTDTYDVQPEELFSLRNRMVTRIATALSLATTGSAVTPVAKARDRDAFRLCLKGLVFWSRRYEDGLTKAAQCFREAIALEPDLALAHAGLADTYSFLGFYSLIRPRDAFDKAREHALQALLLEPSLAQAHISLGIVRLGADWDWDGAIDAFQRALSLDKTQALAHVYLSWTYVLQGHMQEAHAAAGRAQDCDPTSPLLNAAAGYTFFLSRSFEKAIAECEKALEIDENFLVARYVMALCKGEQASRQRTLGARSEAKRLYAEAIRELEFVAERSGGEMVFYLALLGKMYADSGEKRLRVKAIKMLERFDELRASRYVGPHAWVYVYAGLGELDLAFAWQEKARHDGASPFNYLSPQLGCLHDDPRFLRNLRAWNAELSGTLIRKVLADPPEPAAPQRPA
jgi:eukaryotic-like serine/threonine-protein kinase